MTALADSLDAFTRWTKTIEAKIEQAYACALGAQDRTAGLAEKVDAFDCTQAVLTLQARIDALEVKMPSKTVSLSHGIGLVEHGERIDALEVNVATLTQLMRGSSVAERRAHNPEVAGAIPAPATTSGPSFTARAGETITIKCVIPNCEVCEARKP